MAAFFVSFLLLLLPSQTFLLLLLFIFENSREKKNLPPFIFSFRLSARAAAAAKGKGRNGNENSIEGNLFLHKRFHIIVGNEMWNFIVVFELFHCGLERCCLNC